MVTIKEWTDALRSGKYKQGTCFLRVEDKFCCLGVLCDLVDSNGWRPLEKTETDHFHNEDLMTVFAFGDTAKYIVGDSYMTDHVTQILPEYVADQIGITMEQQDLLTQHNDLGVAFDVIADMIDGGLENLKRPDSLV